MKTCPTCGYDMYEDCGIRVKGVTNGASLQVIKDASKPIGGKIGDLHCSVCPKCGTTIIFTIIDDREKKKHGML